MTLLAAVIGLLVGSFLNLCIDRIPRGQSLVWPWSHCEACGRPLGLVDLIPLLSYLRLRGRCRTCGAPIPWRAPVVELATGALFVLLWLRFDPAAGLPALAGLALGVLYLSLFVAIFVIDLEHQVIPNVVVYPSLALALALAPLTPNLGLPRALAGSALGFGVLLVPYLLYPAGLGGGDVKLGALLGAISGFPLILLAYVLAFVSGGVVAALLLLLRLRGRKDPIPFGPFLVLGGGIALLWGEPLWSWYLGQF